MIALFYASARADHEDDLPQSVLRLIDALEFGPIEEQAGAFLSGLSLHDFVLSILRDEAGLPSAADVLRGIRESFTRLPAYLGSVLTPIGIWSVSGAMLGEKEENAAGRVCACAAVGALIVLLAQSVRAAQAAAERASALGKTAAPLLATLLSASGGASSSALLSPAASFAAQLCSGVISSVTIPLLGCAGILSAAPALSQRFGFSGVRRLIVSACNWIHGGLLGLFTGFLGLRGMLKSGADSLSLQTARYTVDSLLPVVGGDVADSLGLLIASARAVHAGAGVALSLLMAAMCAEPVGIVLAGVATVRISRILSEPLGITRANALLEGFGDVFRAMLVAIVCSALLFWLLVGSSVSMARAIL